MLMETSSSALPLHACPFCGHDYASAARVIITESKQGDVVHVTCLSCRKAMAMSIERTPTRVRSVGVMTDCNANDYKHFLRAHKITLDDVLRVHQGLRK